MKFFLGVVSAALLVSCNQKNLKYDKPYFDFDSLVNHQVHQIASAKARVIKKTFLNVKNDSTILSPDTTQWKRELDAFQQLDVINKPLFKGGYQANNKEDDHSNLIVRSFSTKMKSPVPEVKFFYQGGFKKLKRIESVFNESNVLYSTSRKLTLEFEEQQGMAMISKYRVQGFQKMILSDSVKFSIEGKLLYQ
ncbi:MAG TPA: hypothetical protein VGQ59_01675 [Cyclobacteriaceae bacterium]|jgi:hypothetical protein|nr:hypothetical protein [Cyclobacteriaceae bacterium]